MPIFGSLGAFFSRAQLTVMYELAKCRHLPAQGMSLQNFLSFLGSAAPDSIQTARFSAPSVALPKVASLFFDGKMLHWREAGNNDSWPAYFGRKEFWENNKFNIKAQQARNEGPLPEAIYLQKASTL